jgi:hypothetical protein
VWLFLIFSTTPLTVSLSLWFILLNKIVEVGPTMISSNY